MITIKTINKLALTLLLLPSFIKAGFGPSTLINTPEGMKKISTLKEGEVILGYDAKENKIVEVKITNIEREVLEQPITITFNNNQTLITSKDQLLYCYHIFNRKEELFSGLVPLSTKYLFELYQESLEKWFSRTRVVQRQGNKILSIFTTPATNKIQQSWNTITHIGHNEEQEVLYILEVEYPHTFLVGKTNIVAASKNTTLCTII